ncbi:hypothetical protein ACFWQC_20970 [Nocardioides sp. NPDC058538]|uniref:hypothetical protein n=1 Tax=Nocardioides sp. NPDC058538 TaxID=3346542 RepID=UPI0036630C81
MSTKTPTPTPAPTPAEIRGLVREWRRGHVTAPWGEVLYQAYLALLTVLIYGSGLVSAVVNAGQAVEGCTTGPCVGTRSGSWDRSWPRPRPRRWCSPRRWTVAAGWDGSTRRSWP